MIFDFEGPFIVDIHMPENCDQAFQREAGIPLEVKINDVTTELLTIRCCADKELTK